MLSKIGVGKIGVCLKSRNLIKDLSNDDTHNIFYIFTDGSFVKKTCISSDIMKDSHAPKNRFLFGTLMSQDSKTRNAVIKMSKENTNIITKENTDGVSKPFSHNNYSTGRVMREEKNTIETDRNLVLLFMFKDNNNELQVVDHDTKNKNINKIHYNDSIIYYDDNNAFIPARVHDLVAVKKINNSEIDSIIPEGIENFYLYPENSNTIVLDRAKEIHSDDYFIFPDTNIKKDLEKLENIKITISIGDNGYNIKGVPINKIKDIIGGTKNLPTELVQKALKIVGVDEDISKQAMKESLEKCKSNQDSNVDIYGANPEPVDVEKVSSEFKKREKHEKFMEKAAEHLNRCLAKEASEIDDNESVEAVLSLNFINKDTLKDYIESIPVFEKASRKIASLLIASRLGVKTLDEDALKSVLENLDEVIKGLYSVRAKIKGNN